MKLLILDTCGNIGSIALVDTGLDPAIGASATLPGRTASEQLVASIKQLTAATGIPLQSLDAIAVVHGPGSFTGVRVGLSAAKGLCEALHVPLIAISRLAVLANFATPTTGICVFPLIDAGRGEFYLGVYADGVCLREALVNREQLNAAIAGAAPPTAAAPPIIIACEASVAQSLAERSPQLIAEPTAEDALPLVLRRLRTESFEDPATLDANYLRRTDAEIFAKPVAATQPAHQHSGMPAP